ncbi:hypothetical protein BOX15_Mlig008397g1 [Macrostomum lignano]|uniref:Uncharacterized protein n=1 Tax=Macrostomum lignano TaxID=282301 RepID=A0A267FGR7_9PLAT|nr:hypothetical protein BOX15_Mlig008397g1 [Macrostomum lignano]
MTNVNVTVVFRTEFNAADETQIGVQGNCNELQNVQRLATDLGNNVRQTELKIKMVRDDAGSLKVSGQDLSVRIFVRAGPNDDWNLQHDQPLSVVLKATRQNRFLIWFSPDGSGYRVFPTETVKITFLNHALGNGHNQQIAVQGNCAELLHEKTFDQHQTAKVDIEMFQNRAGDWKVPLYSSVPSAVEETNLKFSIGSRNYDNEEWNFEDFRQPVTLTWKGIKSYLLDVNPNNYVLYLFTTRDVTFQTNSIPQDVGRIAVKGNCREIVTEQELTVNRNTRIGQKYVKITMLIHSTNNQVSVLDQAKNVVDLAFRFYQYVGDQWQPENVPQRSVQLTVDDGNRVTIESAFNDRNIKLFVLAEITVRTHYSTSFGEMVAVVGSCDELGNENVRADRKNMMTYKHNSIREKQQLNIKMCKSDDGSLTLPNGCDLSFGLAVFGLDERGNLARSRPATRSYDVLRSVPLNTNGGRPRFTLETNWGDSKVRMFSADKQKTVKIRIRVEYKTQPSEKLVILGNCVTLGNLKKLADNEMDCIMSGESFSTWARTVTLKMVECCDNTWKLPPQIGAGDGNEALTLRLALFENRLIKYGTNTFKPTLRSKSVDREDLDDFDLQCTFDGVCWVCISLPVTDTCRILRDNILTLMHRTLRVHLPQLEATFDKVKDTYAQCLVPVINLDGSYNKKTRRETSGTNKYHDIWGDALADEEANPQNQNVPAIRSAIEYCELRKSEGLRNNREAVCQRLNRKYHARQVPVIQRNIPVLEHCSVYELFRFAKENNWSKFLIENSSDPEYKNALIELAHWVKDTAMDNRDWFHCLFRQSAAIVRGRMEASLVSKECDVMHKDWYWCWKSHMEVAACWFVVMMAAWRRLDLEPGQNNENFKESLREPGGAVVPSFYRWN